jgi:hypothetical protein
MRPLGPLAPSAINAPMTAPPPMASLPAGTLPTRECAGNQRDRTRRHAVYRSVSGDFKTEDGDRGQMASEDTQFTHYAAPLRQPESPLFTRDEIDPVKGSVGLRDTHQGSACFRGSWYDPPDDP